MGNCDNTDKTLNFSDSRRGFLKLAMGALALLNGLVLGVPSLKTLIRAAPPLKMDWNAVGNIESLSLNVPQKINFPTRSVDAYVRNTVVRSVWVIKDAGGGITVFSPVCTHLGCYFTWNNQTGHFECPCHASVFSLNGDVLGGPAPRALDRLPHKVESGMLLVRWEEFRSGTTEKIGV